MPGIVNLMFVYIVECRDGSFYTGCTRDLDRRLIEHNTGKRGAKSIRGKLPVKLVYKEDCNSVGEALRREREIKGWTHAKKLILINKVRLR